MLDADFTAPPEAVEHILAEHDAALARGRPAVFTTCLAGWGGVGPADWLARTVKWSLSGDPAAFRELLATWPEIDGGIFAGHPQLFSPGPPRSEPAPTLKEGMPIVWRGLLNVMGGFDEAFGEWGDDKVELVDRLKGLAAAGLIEMRIVTSVRALHQPHDRDPGADTPAARARQAKRLSRLRMIEQRAAWWRPQVEAARDALPGILAPLRAGLAGSPAQAAPPPSTRQPGPADEILAEAAASAVNQRWKGHGPVLVIGPIGDALRRRLDGREVLALDPGAIGSAPAGGCSAVVVADACQRLDDGALRSLADGVARAATQRAPVVVIEVTASKSRGHAGRDALRPPIAYQRLFGGADVVGHRKTPDGLTYTILRGRLR
jgi:hypothetical protein